MNILVQKFGGSSVSTPERREGAARKVLEALRGGYMPVVVVSAMGRKGDPYATDSLLTLAGQDCRDMPPRSLDMAMACGELLSAVVFSGVLRRMGYDSVPMTGGQAGILTDGEFGRARAKEVHPDRLLSTLREGRIPVVAGFQGVTLQGDFTTLGRGGSDTTAALLGEALQAGAVEIYTDVDGIMTADPHQVPNAQVLGRLSYNEVFQLADQGAKVIHPGAVEVAMRSGVPLIIKNAQNDRPGTLISTGQPFSGQEARVVTSITYMAERCQCSIMASDEAQEALLTQLAQHHVSIDLINLFPDRMIFTVGQADRTAAAELCEAMGLQASFREHCNKVSAVGEGMRGVPGVMARIRRALVKAGVEVLQTSDSHMTISVLVEEGDTTRAVLALHEEFGLWK